MKKGYKRLIIGSVVIIVLLIIFRKYLFASAKWGGIVYGRSHEHGGVKGFIKDSGEIIEVEEGEAIINKQSMAMQDEYICQGTPRGIASEINEVGGGVQFDDGAKCILIGK